MKQIHTFNHYHLGDQLVHLHFLRALARAHPELFFTHTCDAKHIAQLHPVVADLPNLSLSSDWANLAPGAHNAWRGENSHWHQHPHRNDFARYHVEAWFPVLAERMGLLCPLTKPEHMLFDYPALKCAEPEPCDLKRILIVNCPPMSGQWAGYNSGQMNQLAADLWAAGHVVLTVVPTGHPDIPSTIERNLDVSAIGRLSIHSDCIIGCVTGPMWPCLNAWNAAKPLRIHLLDTENVTFCENTVHANATALVPEILKSHGYL